MCPISELNPRPMPSPPKPRSATSGTPCGTEKRPSTAMTRKTALSSVKPKGETGRRIVLEPIAALGRGRQTRPPRRGRQVLSGADPFRAHAAGRWRGRTATRRTPWSPAPELPVPRRSSTCGTGSGATAGGRRRWQHVPPQQRTRRTPARWPQATRRSSPASLGPVRGLDVVDQEQR
jgi:hypothetical protein